MIYFRIWFMNVNDRYTAVENSADWVSELCDSQRFNILHLKIYNKFKITAYTTIYFTALFWLFCAKVFELNRSCYVQWIKFVRQWQIVFTARRNARIASAVLIVAIPFICLPSVCLSVCPYVTCRYCVKTTARSTMQFALSDSKMCLVL